MKFHDDDLWFAFQVVLMHALTRKAFAVWYNPEALMVCLQLEPELDNITIDVVFR